MVFTGTPLGTSTLVGNQGFSRWAPELAKDPLYVPWHKALVRVYGAKPPEALSFSISKLSLMIGIFDSGAQWGYQGEVLMGANASMPPPLGAATARLQYYCGFG